MDARVRQRRRHRRPPDSPERPPIHGDRRDARRRSISATSEELWIPAALTAQDKVTFDGHSWTVLARLKPGVAIDAARAQMFAQAVQLEKEQPQTNAERRATVIDFMQIFVGDVRQRLYVLLGAVALVLLIACGNVANLLLARGAVRSTELAVRAAMGAGRGRLIRQLFTESLLLAGIGTLAGLVLAYAALGALIALSPPNVPRLEQARIDGVTLAFAAIVALVSSLVFGLVPPGAPRRRRRRMRCAAAAAAAWAHHAIGCAACSSRRKWRSRCCCWSDPDC